MNAMPKAYKVCLQPSGPPATLQRGLKGPFCA